ncbi:hypothetical protein GCM10025762_11960 [Haloechinothrix salitolerans]|uniref:hypothetical protein n=1 Tax=Haloechinothrix salitolerans TaxID=926830 RepID=UPI0031EC8097
MPPAPDITDVTRTDSAGTGEREPAAVDGDGTEPDTDTYWTNQTGDDLQVSFTGGRTGYQVQVVDGDGNAVTAPQEITSDDGGGTIAGPVGTDDGRQVRGVRLINAAGAGAATFFDVVVDRTAPAIANATASGDQVTVTLTEIIAFGTDFASDRWAWEHVPGGRDYYQAQQVDTTDRRDQRLLTVELDGNGEFCGVDYLFDNGSGARRYEDRAGNLLADTLP